MCRGCLQRRKRNLSFASRLLYLISRPPISFLFHLLLTLLSLSNHVCSSPWSLWTVCKQFTDIGIQGIPRRHFFLHLQVPTGASTMKSPNTTCTSALPNACGQRGMPTCRTMSSQRVSCHSRCMKLSILAALCLGSLLTAFPTSTNTRFRM